MILKIEDITMNFNGVVALQNVNITVKEGEIYFIIGPNGAGKTTLFNNISGIIKPTSGKIFLHSEDITGLAPYKIFQKGISRTFQNIRLFKEITVFENVLVSYENKKIKDHENKGILNKLLNDFSKNDHSSRKNIQEVILEILSFVGLEVEKNQLGKNLPYGKQRILEIARALASNPKIILLDEPTAGMNTSEINKLIELIYQLNHFGLTVICVEHNMDVVMDIADNISVLNFGEKIAEGKPEELRVNEKVIEAYLGGEIVHA